MGFPFRVLPGDEKTHHAEDFTGRSSLFNIEANVPPQAPKKPPAAEGCCAEYGAVYNQRYRHFRVMFFMILLPQEILFEIQWEEAK